MKISVGCYSGYRMDESPRCLRFGSLVVEVEEVVDRWLSEDHRYFKVRCEDGATYIIRQDFSTMEWELTYYKQATPDD